MLRLTCSPRRHTGFRRFIRREPLGVVFVIAAWNYPYLISVNCVIPALLAGASRLHPSPLPAFLPS